MTYPLPNRTRWQPIRCGLLNLFRYDDQEFYFEDGHLLLRGSNGSGKSRVLALTLPFLFDGELDPTRMEPDRDRHKRVEWNLLMGHHTDRTGYTWIEFGRKGIDGPEYLTLGCGMNAVRGRPKVDRWFFITPLRIKQEFQLQTEHGHVYSQRRLTEELGARGEIYTTARHYRQAVNNRLFGLDEHRYSALINLLIELRQPQLSRKFEEGKLSAALTEALPPLSESVLQNVADAFRGLDEDHDKLENLEKAIGSTNRFLKTYETYIRTATRRRAEGVRHTHSRYEESLRRLKHHRETLQQIADTLAEARAEETRLELAESEIRATIETLADSPEMRQARDLERAGEAAREAETRVQQAEVEVARLGKRREEMTQRHERSQEQASATRTEVNELRQRSEETARASTLETEHTETMATLQLPDERNKAAITSVTQKLVEHARRKRRDIEHLEKRNVELAKARTELERARNRVMELNGQLDDAMEQVERARTQQARFANELSEQVRHWYAQLQEMQLDDPEHWLDDLGDWAENAEGESPVTTAARRARDEAAERIGNARAELRQNQARLQEERQQQLTLAEQLRTGYHQPPPAPHFREREPDSEGVPLWQLCDFNKQLDPQRAAGLEAALEASGILDALVYPDGTVVAAKTADTLLKVQDEAPLATNLTQVLEVAVDGENPKAARIGETTISAILERIGLGTEGKVRVDVTGHWRVGPLQGYWHKQQAEHIGQGAREERRRRQLQEIEARLAELDEALAALSKEQETLQSRSRTLNEEWKGLPDHEPLRRVVAEIEASRGQVTRMQERVAAAERHQSESRIEEQRIRTQRDEEARTLKLQEHVEELAALASRLSHYERELATLKPTLEKHLVNLNAQDETERDLETAKQDHQRQQEHYEHQQTAAHEARARYDTLQQMHGKTVEEVRRRLHEAKTRETEIRASIKRTNARITAASTDQSRLERDISYEEQEQQKAETERGTAIERLRRFGERRLLTIAHAPMKGVADEAWSVTRAVGVARELEQALHNVPAEDKVWDRLNGRIHQTISELIDELRPLSYEPFQEKVDGVMLVMVPTQGREYTMTELRESLMEQRTERRALLSARERNILEKHLIGEVTQELHGMLRACEDLVYDMNEELKQRPTSSGLTLRFRWKTHDDASPALQRARKLLMRTSAAWSPQEREALGGFLQQRIEEARNAEETGSWYDHLRAALDYRAWHHFSFEISDGRGRPRPLNRRSHGEKSGGEKVTALMLLQLAAATAHYRSARDTAPRLILLDEAFVGVDDKMRAQCMGLLGSFELDFIMTSEREKGCYETLPGVSICQLSSRAGIDAVFVSRVVWNGKEPLPAESGTAPWI